MATDTLSNTFVERHPKFAKGGFDVVLANPPFKGSLDFDMVEKGLLGQVQTKKTELLFLVLILRMLRTGGRSATIVPDGVLFGSSKAHVALRKLLVEDNQLEGIVSLPSGVFKPYAGVSTAILVFTKGGETEHVWFFDVQADGRSLDDKRAPVAENDLPAMIGRWKERDVARDVDRKSKAFFVGVEEIRQNGYDLSINRYKEAKHEEVEHEPPREILARLRSLDAEIAEDLQALEGLLR